MADLKTTTINGDLTIWGEIEADNFNSTGMLGYRHSGLSVYLDTSQTDYSTSYNYFPILGNSSSDTTAKTGRGNLSKFCRQTAYGDRPDTSYINGIKIGKNINFILTSAQARFVNNESDARAVGLYLMRERNGSRSNIATAYQTVPANGYATLHVEGTIIVEEGDFIFLVGYKATKAGNIDVSAGAWTQLSVITC